jgi:hypothetical protein
MCEVGSESREPRKGVAGPLAHFMESESKRPELA